MLQCLQLVLCSDYACLSDAFIGTYSRCCNARKVADLHERSKRGVQSLAGGQDGAHVV